MNDVYLIWSNEHGQWWKPGSWGYCTGLRGAGHFTRDEAIEKCRAAIPTSMHINMISEIPVRLADVVEFTRDQAVPAAITDGARPWTNDR